MTPSNAKMPGEMESIQKDTVILGHFSGRTKETKYSVKYICSDSKRTPPTYKTEFTATLYWAVRTG